MFLFALLLNRKSYEPLNMFQPNMELLKGNKKGNTCYLDSSSRGSPDLGLVGMVCINNPSLWYMGNYKLNVFS
jgi:hypothetical protein